MTDNAPVTWQPTRDRLAWAIFAVHLALALTYNFTMALGHAPDEMSRHFPYVKFLATHWTLPTGDEGTEGGYLDIHPPLYYLLLTPVYLIFSPHGEMAALRALRLVSPPLILLTLWLWLPVLARGCGQRRGPTLFAFALTAFWPHLFVPAGALNNDVGLLVMSALLLWLIVVRQWEERTWRSAAWWGAVVGLGTLMKTSALPPGLLIILVALIVQHGRGCLRQRAFFLRLLTAGAVALAVCGWWLGRNYLLYGQFSYFPGMPGIPEGMGKLEALFAGYVQVLGLRAINGLWASVWAQMGWFHPAVDPIIYRVLLVVTLLGLAGAIVGLARQRHRDVARKPQRLAALVLPMAGFGLLLLMAIYISIFIHIGVYQGGRYLLPFLPGLTMGLTLGLGQIVPRRLRLPLGVLLVLFVLALSPLAWYRLITYWNPFVAGKL